MSDMKRTITPNEPADFTPTREPQIPLRPFRYWCQKVLPLVYDDSLSYYELLCKVVDYLNKTMEDVSNMDTDVTNLLNAYNQLQEYVNNYFSTLDVQTEIDNKLDELVENGTLTDIVNEYFNPRYILIMDSYGGYANTDGTLLSTLIGNIIGCSSADIFYKGGIGFTNVNKQGTFTSFLNEQLVNIENKEKVNYVVCLGGANDYGGDSNEIISGIFDFKNLVTNNMPNAKIKIGSLSRSMKYTREDFRKLLDNTAIQKQAYKIGSINNNIEYIYGSENIMAYAGLFGDDLIHPAPAYVSRIATFAADGILHNNILTHYNLGDNLSPVSGEIWSSTLKNGVANVCCDNGIKTMALSCSNVTLTRSSASALLQEDIVIANIPKTIKAIFGNNLFNYRLGFNTNLMLYNGSDFVSFCPAFVTVNTEGNIVLFPMTNYVPNKICDRIYLFLNDSLTVNADFS